MILLILFRVFFNIVEHFCAVIIPNVPQQVMEIVARIFEMMEDGFDILFYCFFDMSVVTSLLGYVFAIFAVFLAIDIFWNVLHKITLRRPYHE